MPSISRLAVAVLCCSLSACASIGIDRHGLWTFHVKDEPAMAPPAVHPYFVEVHPYFVQVFWIGETPEYPFEVIGRFAFTTPNLDDNTCIQDRVRQLAGRRGADVVVLEYEEVLEGDDSCFDPPCMRDLRRFRGVLGRRPPRAVTP